MKKKYVRVIVYAVSAFMLVSSLTAVSFLPAALGSPQSVSYAANAKRSDVAGELDLLEQYIEYIHENYKDEVEYDTLINGAFKGVTDSLGDRFSEYYKDREASSQFTQSVEGEFEGVGVNIHMVNGECVVISPVAGSPAQKAGIRADDVITAVDGKSTAGLNLTEVSELLRGKKGTQVKITVRRGESQQVFTVKRETVNSPSITYEMITDDIGYMAISGFDNDVELEFKMAKIALTNSGAEKIIIDLRNNPGGFVDKAIDIADQILASGYISHFESRGKVTESVSATPTESVLQPIVLLVNGGTASASEILTAALKDNGKATVVGTTTYGKGIAQKMMYIGDEKAVKLSTYYFVTPKKNAIHEVGITPDYVVPNQTAAYAAGSDAAAGNAAALKTVYESFAPMPENTKPTAGDTGLNVYGAQQRLAFLGYDVELTGTMDAATVAAVKAFQKQSGMYAYGILDFSTRDKLDAAAASYAAGTAAEDLQLKKAVELLGGTLQ